MPEPDPQWDDPARDARWETLLELREKVLWRWSRCGRRR